MKQKNVEILILLISIVFIFCLIGMIFNLWYLVFITIPIASILFFILSVIEKLKNNMKVIISFSVIITIIFSLIGFGITDVSQTFLGLSLGAGTIVYILWPAATISGILYVFLEH